MTPAILALAIQIAAASPIEGRWKSPGGNSIIDIAPCGDALCGTVAWASVQAKADAARTTSQLIGSKLLSAVVPGKPGRWSGRLFIPDRNMRVTAKLTLVSTGQLKVSGCLAGKVLCKSTLWTRADGPLPAQD